MISLIIIFIISYGFQDSFLVIVVDDIKRWNTIIKFNITFFEKYKIHSFQTENNSKKKKYYFASLSMTEIY